MGITLDALAIMNSYVNSILERISARSTKLAVDMRVEAQRCLYVKAKRAQHKATTSSTAKNTEGTEVARKADELAQGLAAEKEKAVTVTSREVQNAVRVLLPGEVRIRFCLAIPFRAAEISAAA